MLACPHCEKELPLAGFAFASLTRNKSCPNCGARLVVDRPAGQLVILFLVFVAMFIASVRFGMGAWLIVPVMLGADALLLYGTGRVRELPPD